MRTEVRRLLERSPAFARLPAEARRQVAHGTVTVAELLADPGWLTAPPPPLAEAMDAGMPGFQAAAVQQGTKAFGDLVQKVDFPAFVASLVQGVFQALVDASIQQMTAYQSLVEGLVKSAAQFGEQAFSDDDARGYLTSTWPSVFQSEGDGPEARLSVVPGASFGADQAAELGVPAGTNVSDPQGQKVALSAAKTVLGRQRQQTLATLVMMGINRIVVTNGRINAKVVFDVQASDAATHKSSRNDLSTKDVQNVTSVAAGGLWGAVGGGLSSSTSTHVFTSVSSAVDDTSDAKAQMRAQLSGDVDLSFKSETMPLERLADAQRVTVIQQKAGTAGQGATA